MIISVSDNDQPTVVSSNNSPVEGRDNVTLTCVPATTDTITGYEWYKDDSKITINATNNTYSLPANKRANSGLYQCKVMTKNLPGLSRSEVKNVTFLCKLLLRLI